MSLHSNADECPEPYSGKYHGSFAYFTIKDRLPVILTKVIDSLSRDKHIICSLYGQTAKDESKDIIGHLSGLQNEMVTNKPIKPLVSCGLDVCHWNEYLKKETQQHDFTPSWFDSAWLYVECYLYRRIKQAFELSTMLQHYDPFKKQKEDAFLSSIDAAVILATSLQQALSEIQSAESKVVHSYFIQFLEVALWGNKCDLSISAGKENVQITNSLTHLNQLRDEIIVNNSDMVWDILQDANKKSPGEVCIDLVLDNSGLELFCDMCFLHFLKTVNLVNKVRLYVKTIPWFVSDTIADDIEWLLETLSKSDVEILVNYGKQWRENLNTCWVIETEIFWTLPHDYSEMQEVDHQLYSKLSQSDLIVFKGDLNYRKLTSDRQWKEDTPFITSLRGFLPSSLVSLRTIKAEVVVGLKLGTTETLRETKANWLFTGDFAVIQCVRKS